MELPVLDDLLRHFPHEQARQTQKDALAAFATAKNGVLLEMPTGSGKTAVGVAALLAAKAQRTGPVFYLAPTKTLVDQVTRLYPDAGGKMLGRAEHSCLYYLDKGKEVTAQESPCYMLKCGHRVSQQDGVTEERGVEPCPYFKAKYEARMRLERGEAIITTTAFFLMNRLLVDGWRDLDPALVVLDEVHKLAATARRLFEHTVTDWHLDRAAKIVAKVDAKNAERLADFRAAFVRMSCRKPDRRYTLLKDDEVVKLAESLDRIQTDDLEKNVKRAVRAGDIDPAEQRQELKLLEDLARGIPRMLRSLRYALGEGERNPLNYVVAFHYRKDDPAFAESDKKARFHLTIRSYFVRGLIQKALGKRVLAYSGTIKDPKVLAFETGIEQPFRAFASDFSADRTRIYVPTDTPNLAHKEQDRNTARDALRQIVRAANRFVQNGHRSLVIVTSEEEREKFLFQAEHGELKALSYGHGRKAKEVAAAFAAGEGQTLVGTAAQYAEGVDLPDAAAPVIFFLRPGYPSPDDPEAQFEERRFGKSRTWGLRRWRTVIEALQVRGRNIRSEQDKGVCFFVSQQFRDFLRGSLPDWLVPAYRGGLTLEQATDDALKLLG